MLLEFSYNRDSKMAESGLFVCFYSYSQRILQTSTAIKDANCSLCLSLFDYWPMPCDLWHEHLYCCDANGWALDVLLV